MSYPRRVDMRTLLGVGLLVAAAFALASELIVRDGVGVVEYVVGIAIIIALVFFAIRLTRHAVQRS